MAKNSNKNSPEAKTQATPDTPDTPGNETPENQDASNGEQGNAPAAPPQNTTARPQAPRPAAPAMKKEEPGDLPADFPKREALIAAGIKTKARVREVGDLTAIKGIRTEDVTPIRRAAGWIGEPRRR